MRKGINFKKEIGKLVTEFDFLLAKAELKTPHYEVCVDPKQGIAGFFPTDIKTKETMAILPFRDYNYLVKRLLSLTTKLSTDYVLKRDFFYE